jgi:hypothetical protein
MGHWEENQALVAAEIAKFPATFGLTPYPDDVFRLSVADSFVSEGRVRLYTEVLRNLGSDGEKWLSFAKCAPHELRVLLCMDPRDLSYNKK